MIETIGLTAAVEAADVACKAAKVAFLGYETVDRGLVTVKFTGDVAAVRAAVTAGAAAARKLGTVVSVHVIPRPHGQLNVIGPYGAGLPGRPSGPGPEITGQDTKDAGRETAEAESPEQPAPEGGPEEEGRPAEEVSDQVAAAVEKARKAPRAKKPKAGKAGKKKVEPGT